MDDLISRQDAIKELREMAIALYGYDSTSVISCAIHKLQNLPSAEPEWISMTERPPVIENNAGKRVLVTTSWGMVGEAMYCKDHWEIHDNSYQIKSVLAWMPLPKPWKGEKR